MGSLLTWPVVLERRPDSLAMLRSLALPSRTLRSTSAVSAVRCSFVPLGCGLRRSLASTSVRLDDGSGIPPPTARELIAAKQRQLELKYAAKLKQKLDE
jgi:hypothetical protein